MFKTTTITTLRKLSSLSASTILLLNYSHHSLQCIKTFKSTPKLLLRIPSVQESPKLFLNYFYLSLQYQGILKKVLLSLTNLNNVTSPPILLLKLLLRIWAASQHHLIYSWKYSYKSCQRPSIPYTTLELLSYPSPQCRSIRRYTSKLLAPRRLPLATRPSRPARPVVPALPRLVVLLDNFAYYQRCL